MVRCSGWSIGEWTYEGGLKCICRVGANGNLSVINGIYMIVYRKSGCNASIWVVPQKLFIKLLSLRGQELFFHVSIEICIWNFMLQIASLLDRCKI